MELRRSLSTGEGRKTLKFFVPILTAEYVSRIEKKALKKLEEAMGERG